MGVMHVRWGLQALQEAYHDEGVNAVLLAGSLAELDAVRAQLAEVASHALCVPCVHADMRAVYSEQGGAICAVLASLCLPVLSMACGLRVVGAVLVCPTSGVGLGCIMGFIRTSGEHALG